VPDRQRRPELDVPAATLPRGSTSRPADRRPHAKALKTMPQEREDIIFGVIKDKLNRTR
jgi:hypothetical protein